MVGRTVTTACIGGLALGCAWGAWAEAARSPAHHAARGEAALARGDIAGALDAARAGTALDPADAPAQARLAYVSAAAAGAPTRETLRALTAAYDAAPFGSAEEMVWRVDFADAYWASMPDALAARTLSQIDALGRMGDDWRPRVRWCRSAVTEAIAAAACATVPGVEQGADLTD